jgi:soluble lytic murein transglycosylase-like protein
MSCYSKNIALWGVAFVSLLVAASCKDGPSTKPRSPRPARSRTIHEPQTRPDVAARTRAVTAKRRGSWSLTSDKVQVVAELVSRNAKTYDLSEDFIYGIIWVESRFNPEAVSPVGARGLMQLMPRTATYLADCIDWSGRRSSFDAEFNITAGSYYIARLIKEFNGNEDLALAAYNAGPTKVRRWLEGDGLPEVSIEYAAMVQTARTFFRNHAVAPATPPSLYETAPEKTPPVPLVTDEALDRLGLTILIAGLSDKQFGLEREDDANPFEVTSPR